MQNNAAINEIIQNHKTNLTLVFNRMPDQMQHYDKLFDASQKFIGIDSMVDRIVFTTMNKKFFAKYQFKTNGFAKGYKMVRDLAEEVIDHMPHFEKKADFDFEAFVKSKSDAETWIKEFLLLNKVAGVIKPDVFDKAKLFHLQCADTLEKSREGDREGVKALAKELNSAINSFFSRWRERNPNTPIESLTFCDAADTEECAEYTALLTKLHSTSAVAGFTTRVLDLMKTNILGKEKITALIQTHFVGKHNSGDRENNCYKEAKDVSYGDVEFDGSAGSADVVTLRRYALLGEMMSKSLSEKQLEDIVLLEKKLFKYSISPSEIRTGKILEQNSTIYTLQQLRNSFGHVADWRTYIPDLLDVDISDALDLRFLVVCPSFFVSFNKVMRETDKMTILNYLELSSFFNLNRKFPQVFSESSRVALGLESSVKCDFITEMAFPLPMAKMFSDHFRLASKELVIKDMIANLKEVFRDLIREQDWMTEAVKKAATEKIERIRSIVGMPSEHRNTTRLNKYYEGLAIESTFVESLLNVKRFNLKRLYDSIFEPKDTFNLMFNYVPDDANASYDLRDNLITVNVGIMRPPFVDEDSTAIDIYARIGFIAGHEITHSLGLQGLRFSANGIYTRDIDNKTMRNYYGKVAGLKKLVESTCKRTQLVNGRKEIYTPEFSRIKDEIIADLGGEKVALRAYKRHLGGEMTKSIEAEFFKEMSKIFCQEQPLKDLMAQRETAYHPPDFCRLNMMALTTEFRQGNECRTKVKMVDVW